MLGGIYLSSATLAGTPWLNGLFFKVYVTDGISIDDSFDRIVEYVKTLNDTVGISDYQRVSLFLFKQINDTIGITDSLNKSYIKTLGESIIITDNEWLDFVKNGFTWNQSDSGDNIFTKQEDAVFVFTKQEDGDVIFIKELENDVVWDNTTQDNKS